MPRLTSRAVRGARKRAQPETVAITWAPRVARDKVRRLYESDARGLLDEELLEDVGISFFMRCEAILKVKAAREGLVECPRCARGGTTTRIPRRPYTGDFRAEPIRCPVCSWRTTWGEYSTSFRKAQLHSGGAVPAFEAYLRDYPRAGNPRDRMLAVDRLIHEFHYSLRQFPGHPTRPAAVNIIEGKMSGVVAFLDELTYGPGFPKVLEERRAEWRARIAAMKRGLPRSGK
jgi:hypothetical protein